MLICRICFSDNVKIHSIENTQLQVLYENLTSCKLSIENGRPAALCYICHAQLQRCHQFMVNFHQSGDILDELSRNGAEISPETIAVLNKGIQHNFSVTSVETFSFYCTNGVPADVKDELVDVKIEELDAKYELEVSLTNAVLCRVCLSSNVKTHSISDSPLQPIFEKITNTKIDTGTELAICYICRPQLQTCGRLMNKCRKSHNILNELMHNDVQLTQSIASVLNRKSKASYSSTPVECVCHCDTHEVNVVIKEEVLPVDSSTIIEDETKVAEVNEITVKIEPDEETKPKTNFIKKNISAAYEYCEFCNYKSSSDASMIRHLRLHDPKRRFSCDVCSNRYASTAHLNFHKRNVHTFKHKCSECQEAFIGKRDFKRHVLLHTAPKHYPCEKCNKVFVQRKHLRGHYDTAHQGERYPCGKCPYSTSSLKWLQEHKIAAHTVSHCICDICHKTLSGKKVLKHHLTTHYPTRPHQCKVCLKTFSTNQNLRTHNFIHTGERPFKCESCNKSYRDKNTLRSHSMKHDGRRFSCTICERQFHDKNILKIHMSVHIKERIHACDICDATFVNSEYLRRHLMIHSQSRPHSCPVCSKTFKIKDTLRTHMMVHDGTKKYICDECNKSFSRKQYLISHLRYHTDVRPFCCNTCGKHFRTKQLLQQHTRTHTGEKPHACHLCDRRFSQRCALRRHVMSHSGQRPFACHLCHKKFADRSGMRLHTKTMHPMHQNRLICDWCNKVFIDRTKMADHLRHHDIESPFKCETCGKSYSKLCTITQHVRVHTRVKSRCNFCEEIFDCKTTLDRHNASAHGAVKRYACNICEKPLDSLIRLNSHRRLHTGEKQFACELCHKTYVERRDLLHHMKIIHNNLQCFI